MKSQKVTIYIRLCGEPLRPFKKLKVRNPRQCGPRDYYCLRVGGKFEFFAEHDPARRDLNEALHRKGEREHELRIGVAAPVIPGRTVAPSVVDDDSAIRHAITKYIDALHAENNLRPRTIKDKRTELERWADRCTAQRLEDVTRQHLIEFREWFREEGYEEWTTKTNLTTVVTFLKHNPVKSVVGLLKPEDWPVMEDTEPEPYTVAEVLALQSVATEFERLLIRFFIGTGCRDMEIATLEWDDIDFVRKTVRIHKKVLTDFGLWKPKTRAGTRTIPISDALCRDLKAAKAKSTNTLVFPAPLGGVDRHFLRIVQYLAKKAGVRNAKLHRFRDTFITDKVQEGVDLLTLRVWVGHENLETLKLYAQALRNKDERARAAANAQDRYTLRERAATEMNKRDENEKSATSKPAAPKTAKVILNDTDAVIVTGTPAP
jgi:integrase